MMMGGKEGKKRRGRGKGERVGEESEIWMDIVRYSMANGRVDGVFVREEGRGEGNERKG